VSDAAKEHPFRVGQVLYRYEDVVVVEARADDDSRFIYALGGYVKVRCVEGRVNRLTPKGAHVTFAWHFDDRWIATSGRKRYAYPTMAEAWDSYRARKRCQCDHLKRQLLRAEAAFALEQPAPTPAQQFVAEVIYPQFPPGALDRVAAFDDPL
jgi:hypothetical protein